MSTLSLENSQEKLKSPQLLFQPSVAGNRAEAKENVCFILRVCPVFQSPVL